jgi:hypothetical protein
MDSMWHPLWQKYSLEGETPSLHSIPKSVDKDSDRISREN